MVPITDGLPFGKSNSSDVPAKIGPAADVLSHQRRRAQRPTDAMAALQEMKELEEQQRIAAINKKLISFDGHCWCCLQPGCTHEPGSQDCPQCEVVTPDMSDFAESKPPQTRSACKAMKTRGYAQLPVMSSEEARARRLRYMSEHQKRKSQLIAKAMERGGGWSRWPAGVASGEASVGRSGHMLLQ